MPNAIRNRFLPSRVFGHGVVMALALCWSAAMPAAPASSAAAEPPPLVFAFSELPPWKVKEGPNGTEFGGVHPAILRELARRVGRRLEIVDCPYKRCLRLMETGEADLNIGVIETPDRDKFIQFLRTPYRTHSADRVFYVRAGDAARIRKYSDLYGLTIGVASGSVQFKRFDEDARLTKEVAPDNVSNFHKLVLHRVDAVVIAEDQAVALRSELHLDAQIEAAQLHIPDPATRSIAVSRRSKAMALLPNLEKAMQDMRNDGTLAALYDQYYYRRYGLSRQQIRID